MSDIDKSVLDFDPIYTNKETDIEYIIRTTLADRDKYAFTAVKKSRDRKALEEIFGKASVVSQASFVITGNTNAAFSSDSEILVLFRYDFGGGEIPVLYTIPIFTDVVLTSGSPATGGATNYLYATFDAVVGVDGFKLYSSTSAPTSNTEVLLATYTATGAPGSYAITVTDIYPEGSLIKDFDSGNDGTDTTPDSFFGRLGKKIRDGISRINATIGYITTLNTTTGNFTTVNATTVSTSAVEADTVIGKTGTGTGIQDSNGNIIRQKIINIGDWNMTTTPFVTISHGLDIVKIRDVNVLIMSDTFGDLNVLTRAGFFNVSATTIQLNRTASGLFDASLYDDTPFNRGWVIVAYVV